MVALDIYVKYKSNQKNCCLEDSKWNPQLIIIEKSLDNQRRTQNQVKHLRWSCFYKNVYCVQPLTVSAEHFALGASQGYEYFSNKSKQNPAALLIFLQKIKTAMSANLFFKFDFILRTCSLKKTSSVKFQNLLKIYWYKIRYVTASLIKIAWKLRNIISKRFVLLNFHYFR